MVQPVFLLSCLLFSFISSAPLSSGSNSESVSSSEEDLQPPRVFHVKGGASPKKTPNGPEAPSSVIVEVEDTKTNTTMSFAIFIIAEEEGSGTDKGGRSDDKSSSSESNDISSEETRKQVIQPAALHSSSQPMRKEYSEENLPSEEMMGDQPMFTFSDEQLDGFNNIISSDGNQKLTLPDHYFMNTDTESVVSQMFNDFNNSTESSEVNGQPGLSAPDYSDDKNNTMSDDLTIDSNSKETVETLFGDFNNSTELNDQPERTMFDPESQEATSSSSEKVNQDGLSKGSISKDFGFGSRLQKVFHSIQEFVDLLSKGRHREVLDSTLNSLTGSQTGFSLSSDESDESSESVGSNPKNQTSSDPDSDESLEDTSPSFQQGTGSRDSTEQLTVPTTSSISVLSTPDPDSEEIQEVSGRSTQVDNGAIADPVSPDPDAAPLTSSKARDTVSEESDKSVPQVNVSLISDSSEESQESVVGSTPFSPGLSGVDSPQVSSSSEEVPMALSSSSSPHLVTSPGPLSSEESDLSVSPGLESGKNSLHPHTIPISGSDLSPDSDYDPSFRKNVSSEISQEESEESQNNKLPTDANSDVSREANPTRDHRTNSASIAASSEASMDAKPNSGVKDAGAGLSLDATTESNDDGSIEADPTAATSLPSMHVSSGASTDANTATSSELSVEENGDASIEATVVSMKPTTATEYRTNLPESGASTDTLTNIEKQQIGSDVSTEANPDANSPGSTQHASSEENMAPPLPPPPPPRRKRPFRFGFLSPISHSHGNKPVARETVSKERATLSLQHHQHQTAQQTQTPSVYMNPLRDFFSSGYDVDKQSRQQTVSRQSSRKHASVSIAVAANLAKSSSEETN
uniref:dentin sialophosphoprotein-like n=1 Tax=Epinephelus lanceolatus TaxID=310571 RepID=UPI00144685F4|nr:dentin sialophosphoprotein-like [Epinephelus lanceolatus]